MGIAHAFPTVSTPPSPTSLVAHFTATSTASLDSPSAASRSAGNLTLISTLRNLVSQEASQCLAQASDSCANSSALVHKFHTSSRQPACSIRGWTKGREARSLALLRVPLRIEEYERKRPDSAA
ncbi:hypothetical protein HBH76_126440 [Parastagonospora nodorum]|nr:hypothetical protein HBH76_126440 [Parastagonospora nodorum]